MTSGSAPHEIVSLLIPRTDKRLVSNQWRHVVSIFELNYNTGQLHFSSPDERYSFEYESGTITIQKLVPNKALRQKRR